MAMTMDTSRGARSLHWRAPTIMVSSLAAAVILAGGHHAFYASLNGKSADGGAWSFVGLTASQQEINIAAGTTFAFVIKACFVLASSTAYIQLFFRTLSTKDYPLSKIDHWFGGLDDFTAFFRMAGSWRTPLMTLVALTIWLLPIAAVVSPAALSVILDEIQPPPIRSAFVPQPAFESLTFSTYLNVENALTQSGPAPEVARIANAAAAAGSILQIEPPSTNASWLVTFEAPRLACSEMSADLQNSFQDNIVWALGNSSAFKLPGNGIRSMFTFLAWSAAANATSLKRGPFDPANGYNLQGAVTPNAAATGPVDLFILVLPRSIEPMSSAPVSYEDDSDHSKWLQWLWETSTTIHCSVVSSVYKMNFTYSGLSQDQRIEVLSVTDSPDMPPEYNQIRVGVADSGLLNFTVGLATANADEGPVSATGSDDGTGPVTAQVPSSMSTERGVSSTWDATNVQASTMNAESEVAIGTKSSAFDSATFVATSTAVIGVQNSQSTHASVLVGRSATEGLAVQGRQTEESNQLDVQGAARMMRAMSYAAIQEATMPLILGAAIALSNSTPETDAEYPFQSPGSTKSQIFATTLAQTAELRALQQYQPRAQNMTNAGSGVAYDEAVSLLSSNTPSRQQSLSEALEELYLNITVSMASSKSLVYNASSPLAPAFVNVTFNDYGNVYSYAADKLWLAYGIATGITLLNVLVGLWAMVRTGASYSNNFSTTARAVRNADLDVCWPETELPGKDPLPKELGRAELRLRATKNQEVRSLGPVGYTEVSQQGQLNATRKPSANPRVRQREDYLTHSDSRRVSPDISLLEGGERGNSPHGREPRVSRDVSLLSSDDRRRT